MLNLDDITNKKKNKKQNKKWPLIPDHPYRILIIGGSGSRKTNAMLNSINEQDDVDKKIVCKRFKGNQVWFSIKKSKNAEIKHLNDLNAFIECSNTMNYVYEKIDEYNPNRQRKP